VKEVHSAFKTNKETTKHSF